MQVLNLLSKNGCRFFAGNMQSVRCRSFQVERVEPHNKGPVLKFLNENFVYDEPVSSSLKMMKTREEPNPGWNRYFSEVLDEGTSLKYEESGVITAAALCIVKNGDNGFDKVVTDDPQFKKYMDFLVMVEANFNIYKNCKVDQYYYIDCLGVHRDHRKKGLINSFIDHIEASGRQLNCKLLAAVTTNAFATSAAVKVGMKPINYFKFEEYKSNGQVVFKTEKPHTQATVLTWHLSKMGTNPDHPTDV